MQSSLHQKSGGPADTAKASPEEAFDQAIDTLLGIAQRAAEAAVRRGDLIDQVLSDIRARRAQPAPQPRASDFIVASPPDKTDPAPERNEGVSTGSVASRLWDATRKLITITDHLSTLEGEDARMQNQLSQLSRLTQSKEDLNRRLA